MSVPPRLGFAALVLVTVAHGGCYGPEPGSAPDMVASRTAAVSQAPRSIRPTVADHLPTQPLPLRRLNRFESARRLADRNYLHRHFREANYTPPPQSMVLAARIVDGVGQPAIVYYSFGDTGFRFAPLEFYPASAVKLMAAVGGLLTLAGYGLSGRAKLEINEGNAVWRGTAAYLVDRAIRRSDNIAFDRLVKVAGFDALNDRYLVAENGFPHMVIQTPLYGTPLRTSPLIGFRQGQRHGYLPRRRSRRVHRGCPASRNCATLYELHEVLRRVVLHDELPRGERFAIDDEDADAISRSLTHARTRLLPTLVAEFGPDVQYRGSIGWAPGFHFVENAYIVDRRRRRRYFLVAAVKLDQPGTELPEKEMLARGELKVATLAGHTLRALAKDAKPRPILQSSHGEAVTVEAAVSTTIPRQLVLTTQVPGADRLELWVGGHRRVAPALSGQAKRFTVPFPRGSGDPMIVLRAWRQGVALAYRAQLAVPRPAGRSPR